jgi:adenylate cyclase
VIAAASLAAVALIWLALPDATDKPSKETIPVTSFTGQPSIAVLPFEHGSDPEDRRFANGLTDEIIKGLQPYRTIPVISRHASFALRDQGMPLPEIASRLGARYLVTGSVSRRGDRLRVSAGLTNAEGRQLWKDSFEVDFLPESVFALQDEIAQQIAGVSYPQLLEGEINRVAKRNVGSLDAWGHAMNAVEIVNGVNVDQLDEGLLHAERALELDPDLPLAYWARAEIKVYQLVELGLTGAAADVMEEEILEDFQEALDISPFDGALCGCLGHVRVMRGEIDEAEAVFDAVLPINPSNAILRMNYATLLAHQGNLDSARREAELAIRLDPLSRFGSMAWSTLGLVEAVESDLEQAIQLTRRALQVESTETYGQAQLPVLLYLNDRIPAAQDAFADLVSDHPRVNPRNRLTYGWFRPIEPLIRERVTQASGTSREGQSLADLLEWIFLDMGWNPPARMP